MEMRATAITSLIILCAISTTQANHLAWLNDLTYLHIDLGQMRHPDLIVTVLNYH
jgi:hypothetical protein